MSQLPPEWRDLLSCGAALRIGSCRSSGEPALGRALAAEMRADGRVRVLLDRQAGREVVQAVTETRHVALVLGVPGTHQTLHLKGSDAVIEPAGPELRPLLHQCGEAFVRRIEVFGFSRASVLDHWYAVPDDDLISLSFTISGAWDQTPGPGAGRVVELT